MQFVLLAALPVRVVPYTPPLFSAQKKTARPRPSRQRSERAPASGLSLLNRDCDRRGVSDTATLASDRQLVGSRFHVRAHRQGHGGSSRSRRRNGAGVELRSFDVGAQRNGRVETIGNRRGDGGRSRTAALDGQGVRIGADGEVRATATAG